MKIEEIIKESIYYNRQFITDAKKAIEKEENKEYLTKEIYKAKGAIIEDEYLLAMIEMQKRKEQ